MVAMKIKNHLYLFPYAWALASIVFITFYAFPQTDDFCTFGRLFNQSHHNPFIETLNLYKNWTGRYSSSFAISSVGWLFSITPVPLHWIYQGALFFALLIYIYSCVKICSVIFAEKKIECLTVMLFTATLVLMPSKLEAFLWLTGACVYFLGVSLLYLAFSSIENDSLYNVNGDRKLWRWRTLALIFMCVGINEFVAVILGIFIILRASVYASESRYLKQNIAYFSVFLISIVITIFSPGNFIRNATLQHQHDMSLAVGLAAKCFSIFMHMHIIPNKGVLLCLALASFLSGWMIEYKKNTRLQLYRMLVICTTLLISLPVHLFIYCYLSGEEVPGRVINEAYPLLVAGIFFVMFYIGSSVVGERRKDLIGACRVFIFMVGIYLLSGPQIRQLVSSARDFGPIWRSEQLARIDLIKGFKDIKAPALVPPFTPEHVSPPLLQGGDINDASDYWINKCVAGFYSIQSIEMDRVKNKPLPNK
jgi:hypothetical protein